MTAIAAHPVAVTKQPRVDEGVGASGGVDLLKDRACRKLSTNLKYISDIVYLEVAAFDASVELWADSRANSNSS